MATASEIWIFCLILLLIFATSTAQGESNTTEVITTTTTESSGTITIRVWIIYAVIAPILSIAGIVALLLLCRWFCNKRHVSVSPKTKPENKRIVNDLNNDNEAKTEPFDHFVVSHESRKISKKPKKAINCLLRKDQTPSVAHESEPGIERLNKTIDLVTEERDRADDEFQGDAASENAFNHSKEESAPKEQTRKSEQPHVTTQRSESLSNTFKLENENAEKAGVAQSKTLPNTSQTLWSRRRRKPKESAIKRNMKLIKSKLNRLDTDNTDDTADETTDASTSTLYTSSEEESMIDPSFVPSGDEDAITDDEDSGTDHVTSRHSKRQKLENETSKEAKKDTLKSRMVNDNNTQEFSHDDSPIADTITRKLIRRNSKNTKPNETCIQIKSSTDSKVFTQKGIVPQNQTEVSRSESPVAILTSELSADIEIKQKTGTGSKNKPKKTIIKSTFEHVERQGPLATSSFKSKGEEKAGAYKGETKQQTAVVNETSNSSDMNIHNFVQGENCVNQENNNSEKKAFENYKEFEATVMKRRKINLNRSVSLTETDVYKDEMNSRRRKRKYQSLRQTRKESVFDALQTLDKAPKKGILKTSKSLYLKNDFSENSLASRFEGGTKGEENKEMNLPCVHFTENIDTCKVDNETSESYNAMSLSKDNAKVLSNSYPVNIPENESNISNNPYNATVIENRDDLGEDRQYAFNKPQRNRKLEPNDTETTVIVVVSRDIRDENNQDRTGNENYNNSEIVSSNLIAKSSDISATVSLEDAEILEFSRQSDMLSSTPNAFSTDAVESLSPVLTQTSVREQNTLVEANKKCGDSHVVHIMEKTNSISFSDSGSESNVIIRSDVEYYDKKEQETISTNRATASCDEQNLKKMKMSEVLNEEENVNIPAGKETILFPIKNQSFPDEGRTQSKLSFHQTFDNRKYLTEECMAKCKEEETKQFEDAHIYVSERGLIYSKKLEIDNSKTASSSPTSHLTDQNVHQRPPSTLNLADPDYTATGTLEYTDTLSMTPVSPYSDAFVEDDVTSNLETKQVQIPMFIRRQTLNDLCANDRDDILHETRHLQAECPKTGFADIQMSTSLPVEHADLQAFDEETHHTHSSQKEDVSTLSLSNEVRHNLPVLNECANTPILTSECLKRPPFQLKSAPHKLERPKSNPLFDHIDVETTPLKTERSVNSIIQTSGLTSPISQSKSTKTLSPVVKKDARASSQESPMSPSSDIHERFTTQEKPHKNDFTSLYAHSKQRRFVIREDENINQLQNPHQVWTENSELQKKSSTHSSSVKQPAQKTDIPFAQGRKLKRANVLIPLMKDDHKTSERANDFSKDETHIDSRLGQAKESKDSTTRKVFSFRNQSYKVRSKTPLTEMERSPKYPLEQKRSKTPLPVPTYIRSNTEASLKKPLADELKPKQQTHHMESFSRNFLHFPADRRQFMRPDHQKSISISSLRNKRSNTFVYGKHDPNANTLLNRRAKENNTLNGRMNSRKPSERERPKSAMSLRSAPWSTTMETFRTIKAGNGNKQTRESFMYYGTKADNNLNVEHNNNEHADSDSELEAFFANPDAEVLQFDN